MDVARLPRVALPTLCGRRPSAAPRPPASARPSLPPAARRRAAPAPPPPRAGERSLGTPNEPKYDVSELVVQPAYRSAPWAAGREPEGGPARVLVLGECNVCRSVLAAALLARALEAAGLGGDVEVESAATRDYNIGASPSARAAESAARAPRCAAADRRPPPPPGRPPPAAAVHTHAAPRRAAPRRPAHRPTLLPRNPAHHPPNLSNPRRRGPHALHAGGRGGAGPVAPARPHRAAVRPRGRHRDL